ncbi:hypothetical protein MMC32_008411 [Xylographa parallela]|nr:hypothetical protein [Xylographa parallela]
MVGEQRKSGKLPPSYYLQQRQELAVQGRTRPRTADNTKKSLASILKKWNRFCGELYYNSYAFLTEAQIPDFKIFWRWTLDRYEGIKTASSLKNYWRVLRMHILDKADRDFSPREKRDVHNYLNLLIDEYHLRTVPKKKPVIGLDDLYLLLYTHWVLDDRTYDDEHQRVQVATGLLAAVFFGCRPCSLFDTRVKLDENLGKPDDDLLIAHGKIDPKAELDDVDSNATEDVWGTRVASTAMAVDSECKFDSDSSTACDGDGDKDSSTAWENGSDSDSCSAYDPDDEDDGDTDDDCGAGPEETRAFLYRHFTISIVPHSTPGKTLVIDGEDDDPIFSLLDHFIALAMYDDAFEAESAKDVQNMFWVKMPPSKPSLTLKWKRRVLDLPVFRQPLRGAGECGTSPTEPLHASRWIGYLKRLGQTAGFQYSFTQYGLRRGLLNVANHQAPASVRDQIFDHKPGTVTWYLDQEVRFDTKACYLGRPSNDVVQKMARLASLTADRSAPTELSSEQKAELRRHPQVIRLSQKNRALTNKIHAAGYRPISTAKGTPLFEQKKRIEARLNCVKTTIRNRMIEKARKRHFRKADTVAFDSQFSVTGATQTFSPNTSPTKPVTCHLPERVAVVRLTCTHADGLTEQAKLTQRIHAIEARAALCHRQESRRRRPQYYIKQEEADTSLGGFGRGEGGSISSGVQTHSVHLLSGERIQAIS